jgi:hypothetical protein
MTSIKRIAFITGDILGSEVDAKEFLRTLRSITHSKTMTPRKMAAAEIIVTIPKSTLSQDPGVTKKLIITAFIWNLKI